MGKTQIQITLKSEIAEELDELGDVLGVSRSAIVSIALCHELPRLWEGLAEPAGRDAASGRSRPKPEEGREEAPPHCDEGDETPDDEDLGWGGLLIDFDDM